MRGRRRGGRRGGRLVALAAAALLLAGCSGGSRPKFAPAPTTGLAQYLETPPARSAPGTSSWARNYTPSAAQFVTEFYGPATRAKVRASLAAEGLTGIAHVLWITSDLVQADIVLLQFRDAAGAAARRADVLRATEPDTTLTKYSLGGRGDPIVFHTTHIDAQNNISSRAYATVGDVFVELFMFSPVQYERAYLEGWLTTQIARLP